MDKMIKGLHHITSLASDARANNRFFTDALGLRRIKKTVNFDEPSVYHLYYGDEVGTPGSVMTYFPFPNIRKGKLGFGEVASTNFSVPEGSLDFWTKQLTENDIKIAGLSQEFGEQRLNFFGPDNEQFSLIEVPNDMRAPWTGSLGHDVAIRGFHSASMRLKDTGSMSELLTFMGYNIDEKTNLGTRLSIEGNAATVVELINTPDSTFAQQGAGSVHHIAFAVEDKAAQLEVRKALMDTGYQVTPVIDRDYFWAIYFRTPDGVLFEIATNEPGFERDEDRHTLGQALKLPMRHEHLRDKLIGHLPELE